jgi:hypothetical protein
MVRFHIRWHVPAGMGLRAASLLLQSSLGMKLIECTLELFFTVPRCRNSSERYGSLDCLWGIEELISWSMAKATMSLSVLKEIAIYRSSSIPNRESLVDHPGGPHTRVR